MFEVVPAAHGEWCRTPSFTGPMKGVVSRIYSTRPDRAVGQLETLSEKIAQRGDPIGALSYKSSRLRRRSLQKWAQTQRSEWAEP